MKKKKTLEDAMRASPRFRRTPLICGSEAGSYLRLIDFARGSAAR